MADIDFEMGGVVLGVSLTLLWQKLTFFFLFFTTFQNNSCFHVNIDLLKLLIIKCNEKNAIEKGHENKH